MNQNSEQWLGNKVWAGSTDIFNPSLDFAKESFEWENIKIWTKKAEISRNLSEGGSRYYFSGSDARVARCAAARR